MSSKECLYSQLIAAGSQPKRFSFLVKVIRRLIWPFIRPFHFFHLSKLNEILTTDLRFLRTELEALKYSANQPTLFITATKYGLFIGKPQETISDAMIGEGVWDGHIIKLAQEVASTRRGIAIDIGAHFGSSMLPLSSIFDHVHSFEPNDFNFRILRANAILNNVQNVSLHNNALYSHEAPLSLGIQEKQEAVVTMKGEDFDGLSSKNLGAYCFTENGSGIFNRPARTLDSYEFNDVAFIKIDVQGADGEVLMGAVQTIQRCQPVIVFEWEEILGSNFNTSLDAIKNKLSQLGYEMSVLKVHKVYDENLVDYMDYVARPIAK
jgi:FkbM family methyltransferase